MAILNGSRLFLLLCGALLLIAPGYVRAEDFQGMQLNEQKIEAGLLYNFLKYTTWPSKKLPAPDADLRICLFGDDAFDGYLYPLQGRTAQQYRISISHIDNLDSATACHLVFIHRDHEVQMRDIVQRLKDESILTISNISDFAEKGGMIEFARGKDKRIHLIINRDNLAAASLTVQDRLLKLAKLVPE